MSPAEGDALTALERFAAIVRDRQKTRDERTLALRFIIHIIGDLHQPRMSATESIAAAMT